VDARKRALIKIQKIFSFLNKFVINIDCKNVFIQPILGQTRYSKIGSNYQYIKNNDKSKNVNIVENDLVKVFPRFVLLQSLQVQLSSDGKNNRGSRLGEEESKNQGLEISQSEGFWCNFLGVNKYLKREENKRKSETFLLNLPYQCTYNFHKLIIVLSNDVETNPGPGNNSENLVVATYNVQGCRNIKKLKRLCNQFHKSPFGRNWVFNLQETHLKLLTIL